jgi:hypothetical protein
VEYRQPVGDVDGSLSLLANTAGGSNVLGGALIHYEDPQLDAGHTYLIDFTASANPNNFDNATLTPGKSWSDPYSLLDLSVSSANSAGLSLNLTYDQPCATLSPSSTSFAAGQSSGTIGVAAGPACSWTATTAASWITLSGTTSGSRNGSVGFSIAANSGAAQRAGTSRYKDKAWPSCRLEVACRF